MKASIHVDDFYMKYTVNLIYCSIFPRFRQMTFVLILYYFGQKRKTG